MSTFILFALCFAVGLVVTEICDWIGRAKFRQVYPPISDEEFLSRLSPEIPPEVGLKVREVLVECFGLKESEIYPAASLLELMGDVPPRFAQTPPMSDV